MTLSRTITAVATASLLVVVTATAAQSQDGWMRRRASGMMVHRIEHQLHVTDAQRSQIREVVLAETPKIQALAQQARTQNLELRAQQSFDEAAVRSVAQRHAATAADAMVEREKIRFEILQILTPEQRAQAQQMVQQMHGQFEDRLTNLADLI